MDDRLLVPPIAQPLGDVTTERLELKRFEREDLDGLALVFEKPEVWYFPYGGGRSRSDTEAFLAEQIEHWRRHGFGCWVARSRAECRIIGYVGLSLPVYLPEVLPAVEIGWRLEPQSWGKGYATEAATAALDEAFGTLGLSSVCAIVQEENARSSHVAERLGMTAIRTVVMPPNTCRGELSALFYEIDHQAWADHRRSSPG